VASQRYQIRYGQSALDDLRALPNRQVDQILRKIQRLEQGLHGNIKRLQNADVGFRLRMGGLPGSI
jgi:mRNA-degrading endonuclease RelE of RelBE toxin-antitoxin system